jgi:hypothetical protein
VSGGRIVSPMCFAGREVSVRTRLTDRRCRKPRQGGEGRGAVEMRTVACCALVPRRRSIRPQPILRSVPGFRVETSRESSAAGGSPGRRNIRDIRQENARPKPFALEPFARTDCGAPGRPGGPPADVTLAATDAKASQSASGAKGGSARKPSGGRATHRGKPRWGDGRRTKIHAALNKAGKPIAFVSLGAETADLRSGEALIEAVAQGALGIADRAFDADRRPRCDRTSRRGGECPVQG